MKRKPDAIFFDWDGTLIDSRLAVKNRQDYVRQHFGKPLLATEDIGKATTESARESFPRIFGDKSEEALALYRRYVTETHLSHLTPHTGAESLLRDIQKMGIPMAVVSNMHHKTLLEEISHLGWDTLLTDNVGAGAAERDKPAPDPLLLAAKNKGLQASKHELWYIGDMETDMQAALAAGFRPFFIEHGLGQRSNMAHFPQQPVFVKDFQDFLCHLRTAFRKTAPS